MYLAQEIEKQWLMIEQIKLVTGADKYINEKPTYSRCTIKTQ